MLFNTRYLNPRGGTKPLFFLIFNFLFSLIKIIWSKCIFTLQNVDWEVELAVVIGRKAKAIRQDQVNDYIFGYTVAQDISARDWQKKRNNGQFLLGKSMDTFCPLGPAVVTKNKIDPSKLAIKSWVNGKLKQDGNTSELIFKIDFLVSYLSQ